MNDTPIVYIDRSLKDIDKLERAKIGIEFIVANYERQQFSREDKEDLARYFKSRLLPKPGPERGYSG